MEDYLKPNPTDSNADSILKRMLPDYKAEIRRRNRKQKVDFSRLPIVAEAEAYLQKRYTNDQRGNEIAHTVEA